MNKEYLDKVLDKLVSETRIDYDEETLYLPFFPPPLSYQPLSSSPILPRFCPDSFYKYSRDIYGLTILDRINE